MQARADQSMDLPLFLFWKQTVVIGTFNKLKKQYYFLKKNIIYFILLENKWDNKATAQGNGKKNNPDSLFWQFITKEMFSKINLK